MLPLRWTPKAATDLEEIKAYIEQDDPEAAVTVIQGILDRAEQLRVFPESGALLREKRYVKDRMRYLTIQSHMLFYLYDGKQVSVVRVLHARREYLSLLRFDT